MVSLLLVLLHAAPPKVTRVVLFPDRAQVTRSVELDCAAGGTSAHFGDLPATLDPTTLTAAVTGAARVEGVSVSERVDKAGRDERVRGLEAKLEALEVKITAEARVRARAASAKAQADTLRAGLEPFLNRDAAAEKKPDLAGWKSGLDAALTLVDDASARLRTSEAALRTLERDREEVERQRAGLAAGAPDRVEDVDVALTCERPGHVRADLSYLVAGAGWTPVYEARADERRGVISLTTGGEARQATGEDWQNVEVTLSTSLSARDARPPEQQRLYLGASAPEPEKKVLVVRQEEASGLVSTPVTEKPGDGTPRAKVEAQGLSVQLRVPEKADLSGDGRATRLAVETIELPTTFSRVAVPKVTPHVFRIATLSNSARYPLLEGRVELFHAGSYLGSGPMPRTDQNARLELAFGVDDALKVKRTTLTEEHREAGLFGSKRRFSYGYRLELASFAPQPTTIVLREHLPIAELDDVEVRVESTTTAGHADDAQSGVIAWNVALTPGGHRSVELHFVVDVPSKYDSSGL